jgi:repressor of nif and glnA expression
METKTKKSVMAILAALKNRTKPLGATRIAREVRAYGVTLSERTVRYYLAWTDQKGFTRKFGKRGRMITPAGEKESSDSLVMEKVVVSRIDEFSYRMIFSVNRLAGNIVLNISTIQSAQLPAAAARMLPVFEAGLGMGRFLMLREEHSRIGDLVVPEGKTAIGTVCSVTINGILLSAGIPVTSRFGGLLEMRSGRPVRFTQLINYDGTTLDPLEIFIKGRMTSVGEVARTGDGVIGASFREIPTAALHDARKLRKRLQKVGLGAIMLVGNPGQPLLDIPVGRGRVGMIVLPGLNPLAACEEAGIQTENLVMSTLHDFSELVPFEQLRQLV